MRPPGNFLDDNKFMTPTTSKTASKPSDRRVIIPVPERNALVIPRQDIRHVDLRLFARSKPVDYQGVPHTVVPFDLPSCGVLRHAGLKPKGPIYYDYHWPVVHPNHTPFAHQQETADYITQWERMFVFNGIGTAKTLSALWAADYLMRKGFVRRVLVTSTLSTLSSVWDDHIFKAFNDRTCTILHGDRKRRVKRLEEDHDFYIINHDGIQTISEELASRDDIDMVIVDEGAEFRNAKTDKYKALHAFCGPQTLKRVCWMTGSPMPKAPTDVWAQAKMVNPQSVPKFFGRFRERVMRQVTTFKWMPREGWEDTVYSMVQPAIRYKREECIDIRETMVEQRECEMSPQQKRAYDSMQKTLTIQHQEGQITAVNEGVKLGKLLQCAAGAVYTENKEIIELDPKPKLRELDRLIGELDNKAIVFTPFKHSLAMLEGSLVKAGYSVVVISGDVPPASRAEIFHNFQHGSLQVIIAHPKAMAHGLTLTASQAVIWFSPIDDYGIYEQACGRIERPGQGEIPLIIQLISAQVEREVYRRLNQKESMQNLLLTLLG